MQSPVTESRPPHVPLVPPGGILCFAADMTLTVSADVPLRAVQAKLKEHEQWLPIDGDPDATVGQLVERNSTGPLRLGYGAWRDLLLGCQFFNGENRLITAGGRVVKNVAGYDLTKFMVGQRGIFGRLVTLTTRTYRRPAGALLAAFPPQPAILQHLIPTPLRPHWSLLTPQVLLCGYLGDSHTITYYASKLPSISPLSVEQKTLEEDIALRAAAWNAQSPQHPHASHDAICTPSGHTFRAAVPPACIQEFLAKAQPERWSADPAFGIVIGPVGSQSGIDDHLLQERIHSAATAVGGSAFFDHQGAHTDHFPTEAQDRILQALKTAFDPHRTLEAL